MSISRWIWMAVDHCGLLVAGYGLLWVAVVRLGHFSFYYLCKPRPICYL